MKQHQGVWLPDHEKHMIEWMDKNGEMVEGRGTYQIKKLRAALGYVNNWRVAVDVGAHVGFWSMHLVKRFSAVIAFEPIAEHRTCFLSNVRGGVMVLNSCALGDMTGSVKLTVPEGSSGGTHISGGGNIPMRTLDSFELVDVDFVKIDCEGYEDKVIEGARKTLLEWKPVVIVEQKDHIMKANFGTPAGKHPAVELLQQMGAQVQKVISGDYILTWK